MNDARTNAGYLIKSSILVGSNEFVLGVNQKEPNQYVTWQCKNKTDYFWGHYTDNILKAIRDLCERALDEVAFLEQKQEDKQAQSIKKNKDKER